MSDDSFLREVEEELRSDKLKAFWRRFAPFIIGGAVLIVLLVAANEIWSWWRDSRAAEASDSYYAAVELAQGGDIEGARAAFTQIESGGPSGYATLARFQQAALLAQEGSAEEAIAAYDALASSLNQPRLRELAYLFGAYLAVDHLDAAAVESRVGTMAAQDNPLRNQAREALGLAHYKAGDIETAAEHFEAIVADQTAMQDMQVRANIYLEQMRSRGADIGEVTSDDGLAVDTKLPEVDLGAFGGAPMAPVTE